MTTEYLDVCRVRRALKLSQRAFAELIGARIGAVRAWEQGRRQPLGPAAKLLVLLQDRPELAEELATIDLLEET